MADDEVDLRAKLEGEKWVTHEVDHLDRFDDTHLGDSLWFVSVEGSVANWSYVRQLQQLQASFRESVP